MAYNSNAIEIIPSAAGPELWAAAVNAQADSEIWATEEDYRDCYVDQSMDASRDSSYNDRRSQSRAESEQPPNKRPRSSSLGERDRERERDRDRDSLTLSKSRQQIGKMFFKTKLCCKFRAGTCPYITNCNFAHGMEELRKPPPNWQEIVAAHEEAAEQREEHQIPIMTSATNMSGDGGRSSKGRHCKKFYTEEGCPYGDACSFLHDEQSKARESVAISLSPTVGGGSGYNGASNASTLNLLKPSNWKTRICNKWEMTGYCPFGAKCHFAHGSSELLQFGGGNTPEGKETPPSDSKQATATKASTVDAATTSATLHSHPDVYHSVASSHRSAGPSQRHVQLLQRFPSTKWKGFDKISGIYGDWIEEHE